MQLIRRVEINYLRSLYRASVDSAGDINIIFGRNDSGKSNVLRALNLFFKGETDPRDGLDFDLDFSDVRRKQARAAKDRQFFSVRIEFNIPRNFRRSLGKTISIRRQWNSYDSMNESLSFDLSTGSRIQLTRFLNQIDFTYVPAIKDLDVFADLIQRMYAAAAESKGLQTAIDDFVEAIRKQTNGLSEGLSRLFKSTTRLAAPTDMGELFRSLDFSHGEEGHSLLRQKGDGVKARHLPELLRYINENEAGKRFFIWGFEEPENSLDFGAADAEAKSFANIASRSDTQIFITNHSPAFYLSDQGDADVEVRRLFVSKQEIADNAEAVTPKNAISVIDSLDEAEGRMREASLLQLPYLIRRWNEMQREHAELAAEGQKLKEQISALRSPALFVEGKFDRELFESALARVGTPRVEIAVKELEGTPKTTAELLPKLIKSDGLSGDAKTLFLFDNDPAGRSAYGNLCKMKLPQAAPVSIANGVEVWALPPNSAIKKFCRDYEIQPENLYFTAEFLFDGSAAAQLCHELMSEDEIAKSRGQIHDSYHRHLSQVAAQKLREAEPGTDVWFWSRGVPDRLKERFAQHAAQRLDLTQVDAVAKQIIAVLT